MCNGTHAAAHKLITSKWAKEKIMPQNEINHPNTKHSINISTHESMELRKRKHLYPQAHFVCFLFFSYISTERWNATAVPAHTYIFGIEHIRYLWTLHILTHLTCQNVFIFSGCDFSLRFILVNSTSKMVFFLHHCLKWVKMPEISYLNKRLVLRKEYSMWHLWKYLRHSF